MSAADPIRWEGPAALGAVDHWPLWLEAVLPRERCQSSPLESLSPDPSRQHHP